MSKEDLIKMVKESYWPDWEPAPTIQEAMEDIGLLYTLPATSIGLGKEKK